MTHLFPFLQGSVTQRNNKHPSDSEKKVEILDALVERAKQFAKRGGRTQEGDIVSFTHQTTSLHITLKTTAKDEAALSSFGLIITSIRGRDKKTFRLCRIQGQDDVWTGCRHDCRAEMAVALRPTHMPCGKDLSPVAPTQ